MIVNGKCHQCKRQANIKMRELKVDAAKGIGTLDIHERKE